MAICGMIAGDETRIHALCGLEVSVPTVTKLTSAAE
jgi:hypothetical protein